MTWEKARIRVRKDRSRLARYRRLNRWAWSCLQHPSIPKDSRIYGSQQEALEAGLKHLRGWHSGWQLQQPGQLQLNTRCTCGDAPSITYPHFRPCPVHAYLLNTTTNRITRELRMTQEVNPAEVETAIGVKRHDREATKPDPKKEARIKKFTNGLLDAWSEAMEEFFEQVDDRREVAGLSDAEVEEALNRGYGHEVGEQWLDWAQENA